MPPGDLTFPFSAVHGMEDAKRAILCALASPSIRTVLIRGPQGSAKTVLARSAGALAGRRTVNVPLGVTEDQLFGCMDAEVAIREGRASIQEGILHRADGNILYVDDANLMDRRMLAQLLDCVLSGNVLLERDGISASYPVDTVMIATMNPNDSDLDPHLLDRFDLCAYAPATATDRSEVLRRSIDFDRRPAEFVAEYRDAELGTAARISLAAEIIPMASISDDLLAISSELVAKVSADGLRGDISMARASMALAALDGRDAVTRKDVEEAAMICLAHRRRYTDDPPEPQKQDPERDDDPRERDESPDEPRPDSPLPDIRELLDMLDDMVFEVGDEFRAIDFIGERRIRTRTASSKGRRSVAESADASGRYVRSRPSEDCASDLALDATIRAAAPYQTQRERGGLAIRIEPQDIRTKVREKRTGCTILFVVDASGSLGARKRMVAVKGAVLSMLKDSYVRRDKVGLMAFRRDSAELILPPTRSVEYGYRRLEGLPTGGKTPLCEAIVSAGEMMSSYTRAHPGEDCCVVLITDGRGNVPLTAGADPRKEAFDLASNISVAGLRWVVVDASTGYGRFDDAELLASAFGGTYFRLEELDADRLAGSVRAVMGRIRPCMFCWMGLPPSCYPIRWTYPMKKSTALITSIPTGTSGRSLSMVISILLPPSLTMEPTSLFRTLGSCTLQATW